MLGQGQQSALESMNGNGRVSSPLSTRGFGFQGSVGFLRPPLDSRAEVTHPFEENVWVRAGIKAFSEAFSRMPFQVWTGRPADEGSTEIVNHDLSLLLQSPNPIQTQAEFWQAHATNMKLDGENFWFLADFDGMPINNRPGGIEEGGPRTRIDSMPDQIIQVRGSMTQHQVNDRGVPIAYRFPISRGSDVTDSSGAWSPTYPASAVVAFIDYDPDSIIRGFGDVQVVRREIDLYFQAQRYLDAVIRNGGDPGAWIVFKKKTSAEEIQRRQADVDEEYTGDNASRYKVLDSDATVIPNKLGPKDMEYETLLRETSIAILAAIGVPPPMVGLFEDATYNNIETAERILWTGPNGILSMARKTSDAVTWKLLARLGPKLRGADIAVFDFTGIEVLQQDRTPQIELANKMVEAGTGLTLQDSLTMLGIESEPLENERDMESFVKAELRPAAPILDRDEENNATQEATLNGAQIAQLVAIVEKVALGLIPKASAEELIVASFPLDAARASKILASVVEGSAVPDEAESEPLDDDDEDPDGMGGDSGGDIETDPPEQEPFGLSLYGSALLFPDHPVAYRKHKIGDTIEPSKKLSVAITKWFAAYEKATLKLWTAFAAKAKKRKLTETELNLLTLSEAEWAEFFRDATSDILENIFSDALELGAELFGGGVISLSDPAAILFLTEQVLTLESVGDTLTKQIKSLIGKAFAGLEGRVPLETQMAEKLPALTKKLKKVFGNKSARANAISRTETGRAQNGALYIQAGEAGADTIRWITAGDGVVRDSHVDAGNQGPVKYGEKFVNGLLHPHDPAGPAGEVVNCRCTFVIETFKEDE